MDTKLQAYIEESVSQVYKDVKERRWSDMSLTSAESAAEVVLHRIAEKLRLPSLADVPKRVAVHYLEHLLLDKKRQDPNPGRVWER